MVFINGTNNEKKANSKFINERTANFARTQVRLISLTFTEKEKKAEKYASKLAESDGS